MDKRSMNPDKEKKIWPGCEFPGMLGSLDLETLYTIGAIQPWAWQSGIWAKCHMGKTIWFGQKYPFQD